MCLTKLERSCRIPPGCRLATVEEAEDNLEWIKQSNMLEEWDRARLLDGWIGGSRYDFNVQVGFRSCLGYMIVIGPRTPEKFNTEDDRSAVLYSEVPKLSKEGREAALFLSCEDWNKEVLYWLTAGETKRDCAIWDSDKTEDASELVSTIARKWQSVRTRSRAPASIEILVIEFQEFSEALMSMIQESEGKIANESIEKLFPDIPKICNQILDMFKYFGFDTSVPSNWEVVADTIWYVVTETLAWETTLRLCQQLHDQVLMRSGPVAERKTTDDCPIVASLICYTYDLLEETYNSISKVVEAAAKEANGNCNLFDKILRRRWFRILSCEGKYDGLDSLLDWAAKKGNIILVKKLIESGETDKRGKIAFSSYLRLFSRMGCFDVVRKLLDEGADPFDPDDEGKMAIHYAAEGAEEVVAWKIIRELLFDKEQGITNVEKASAGDKYGRSVLHVAAFLGRKRLCRWLLRLNRNLIDSKDRDGQSAIFYAVAGTHDNPEVLEVFISREQATNQLFARDFSQTTPLHMAAARGNLKMVEMLLTEIYGEGRRKAYVEEADVLGQTALHKAASAGHNEVVEMLLASGTNLLKQRDCDGKTALHFAAQADGEDAVTIAKLLLDKCVSDNQKCLLLFASAVGIGSPNSPLKEHLEEEKNNILKRVGAKNLLKVAASLGDIDITREFITRGANIALIRNEKWILSLSQEEQTNVKRVLKKIKNIVEQGTDKPALRDNLGRNPFANGLAALFLNPFVKSPITVGISGEWGMGKSSVMVQTENILLKTAARFAFTNSFQENKFPGAAASKLSAIGQARQRKIANAIERLDAESRDDPFIGMPIRGVKNFITKAPDPPNGRPDSSKFNNFLENYQTKYHRIFKSLAIMDRSGMFEGDEESATGNQTVSEMQRRQDEESETGNQTPEEDLIQGEEGEEDLIQGEEDSMQGTTPSMLTVRYNAWHYRNETEACAGLAVEIIKELEATMMVAHKLRTSWIYNWRNRRNSICFGVILPFFLALMLAIWFSTVVWFLLDTAQRKDLKKFKYGGLPASIIVAAWGVGKTVISFVKPISSQVMDYICLPDHSQKLGYHQQVIDDINFLKEQLRYKRSLKWEMFAFIWCCFTWSWNENYVPETKIPKMPPAFSDKLRIIVFVDDLDRCEENVILQVLSAVNLVLATCEINVILSMENSMIQRAIVRKYGDTSNKATNKSNEDLADKYLRKIVQLPLHLPDPSDKESHKFLEGQLGMRVSKKGSTDNKDNTREHRRANPKFQIGISIPNKSKLGRRETNKDLAESGAEQQRAQSFSDTAQQGSGQTEEQETIEKSENFVFEEATIEIEMEPFSFEVPCSEIIDNEEGGGAVDLSSIISAMLIPKYTEGESKAFFFLHARCTRSRKLPREWKCLMAYHRLAWNILSLNPDVILVEGWQVQLIVWIFVCWQWRHHITTLIQKWNKLQVLRNWKDTEGPSLGEIVEHYIDERWPADKKSATKKKDDAIDSLSNTEEVENIATISKEDLEGDDNLKEVLRKFSKDKEMRRILKKFIKEVLKEEEDNKEESSLQQDTTIKENQTTIKKFFREEEDNDGESEFFLLQHYTTAEENQKTDKAKTEKEEREEWNKLRETLRRYNVSMDGIQTFQKFRFYCHPGHLPWPLPK